MAATLFAYLLCGLLLAAFAPTACVLLARSGERPPAALTAALTLALFAGSLSLMMLWQGLLQIPFSALGLAVPTFALALPGLWAWRRSGRPMPARPALRRWESAALLLTGLIAAAILYNGLALPFYRDDTLGIYLPQAQALFETRALLPLTGGDSLYLAYPMLSQHLYAFAFMASGWENDYLAKALTTLLALGCLPATLTLGQQAGGRQAGWLAALLLALTPAFGRWASSGYADLPMAFFYSLSAVFFVRAWAHERLTDALLAGALMGLAAWTKNAALPGAGVLTVALALALIRRRISWQAAAASLAALMAVAGPWYLRNLVGAGFLMPATVWLDRAAPTAAQLLIFLTSPTSYALSGWFGFFGAGWAVARVTRRAPEAPALTVILWWALPLFGLWWLLASYDPRFLLYLLPFTSALGGALLIALHNAMPHPARAPSRWLFAAVAVALAAGMLWISVEYKDETLRNPLMTDAERREMVGRE